MTYSLAGFGPLLTWYHAPTDFYLDVAPLITQYSVSGKSNTGTTETLTSDLGFGIRVGGGKEWRVSQSWGVGAAIHYVYSSNDNLELDNGQSVEASITSSTFAVTLSATYF